MTNTDEIKKLIIEIKSNPEFMEAIKQGIAAMKEGRFKSWGQVKKELSILPVPDEERREKMARKLFEYYHQPLEWDDTSLDGEPRFLLEKFKSRCLKFADSILRLSQPTLPEIPLLTEEQIMKLPPILPDNLDELSLEDILLLLSHRVAQAQRDLIVDTLRKAGYEEK